MANDSRIFPECFIHFSISPLPTTQAHTQKYIKKSDAVKTL